MAPRQLHRGPSTALYGKALIILFLVYVLYYTGQTISNEGYGITNPVYIPGTTISSRNNPTEIVGKEDLRSILGTRIDTHGYATNTKELHKRADDDDDSDDDDVDHVWQEALEKGQEHLDRLGGSRKQSQWVKREQLEANGWTVGDKVADQVTNDLNGNDSPYQALDIDFAKNVKIGVAQDRKYSNCAHENLEATEAFFDNIYNVQGKLIVATANVSPVYQLKKNEDPMELMMGTSRYKEFIPLITWWSEIVAIIWTGQAGIQASSLKYIIRYSIVTYSTKRIMNKAAAKSSDSGVDLNGVQSAVGLGFIAPWPGIKGDERFRAILGTAHANGIVQLLVNHTDLLPRKDIESVTMFTTDEGNDYHLLFTLTG